MSGGQPLRVLVVDDEPDVRLMLRMQLDSQDGIDVVAEASDGREALDKVAAVEPDVVVMDLLMPRMSGIEAIHVMREDFGAIGVVAYTAAVGDHVRSELARLGVPLLVKSGDIEPLVHALRAGLPASPSGEE